MSNLKNKEIKEALEELYLAGFLKDSCTGEKKMQFIQQAIDEAYKKGYTEGRIDTVKVANALNELEKTIKNV